MKKNIFSLEGKTAVLTGAAGFFGRYFAEGLLASGVRKVVLLDKNKEGLQALEEDLKKAFDDQDIVARTVDQEDHASAKKVYEGIIEEDAVDVLVNNSFDFSQRTGFNAQDGKLVTATYEQLKASFDAGIYWAIQATQVFGAAMKERGSGSIINICTMYSVVVPPPDLYEGTETFNPPGYSMAKAGLLQFTRYTAAWLGPDVRANGLSPGAIPVPQKEGPATNRGPGPVLERLNRKILLKRMGHPNDLVGGLIYLASNASSYVTGQNLVIDGGLTVI